MTVTLLTTPGTAIEPHTAIQFESTALVAVTVAYSVGTEEPAYRDGAFTARYARSTKTGSTYALRRDGGWPASPTLRIEESGTTDFDPAFANATVLTTDGEALLPNSRQLVAGVNVTLVPGDGTLTVSAADAPAAAPVDASYVVLASHPGLSGERVLMTGRGLEATTATAGTVALATTAVLGPPSSTANTLPRFAGATGDALKTSVVTVDDSGNIATSGTVDGRDVSSDGAKLDAIAAATVLTTTANSAALPNSRRLVAGSNITLYEGAGNVTISAQVPAAGAPATARYVTTAADAALANERVLTAGTGISITESTGGTVTIASTVASGAPASASYVTLGNEAALANERVLTAGTGIAFTDGGPGGALTLSAAVRTVTQVFAPAANFWTNSFYWKSQPEPGEGENDDGGDIVFAHYPTAQYYLWCCLPLLLPPHASVVSSVAITLRGAPGHTALPAEKPYFEVLSRPASGGAPTQHTSTSPDSSPTTAAYQTSHTLTASNPFAYDPARKFYAKVYGETGANAISGLRIVSMAVTYTYR
jgi:hypothetical protein